MLHKKNYKRYLFILAIFILLISLICTSYLLNIRSVIDNNKAAVTVGNAVISSVNSNSTSIPQYEKFELTFNISGTTATNLQFPYDTSTPAGIQSGIGINVDGLFTDSSGNTVTQPGFVYQDYDRSIVQNNEYILPKGNKVWKVRFAPTKVGNYSYQIRVQDSSGTVLYPPTGLLTFTATSPTPGNHGFLHVSSTDKRYFEFDDGTTFLGTGTNALYSGNKNFVNDTSKFLDIYNTNKMDFTRVWLTSIGLYGSSWSPMGYHDGGYDGYVPIDGLIPDTAAYNGHQFSWKINTSKKCVWNGGGGNNGTEENIAVKPNTTYKLLVRAKTNNFSGNGLTVKTDIGCTGANLLGPVKTNNAWQEFTTSITTSSTQYFYPGISLFADGITVGEIDIDQVSIKEDLGNGNLGPEIIKKSSAAQHLYIEDFGADRLDLVVEKAKQTGVYLKLVGLEKNDPIWGHINADGSLLTGGTQQGDNANFYATPDKEVGRLHQYYYRYLTARWGYSTNIHSWEYINEGAPGAVLHDDAVKAMAIYFDSNDPNRHMSATSNWHSLPVTDFWGNSNYSNVDYADAHSYVNYNSWLSFEKCGTGSCTTIGPITGADFQDDTAVYAYEHSISALNKFNAVGTMKPTIIGEVGITSKNGQDMGKNDTSDDRGVFLHQLIWGSLNPGDIQYILYWYQNNWGQKNRYPLYKPLNEFLKGKATDTVNTYIPISNGGYKDIQLTLPGSTRGWGQKDISNGGAYFWMYDSNYNYTNAAAGTNMAGRTVSFSGLPAKTYTIEYWNTWTGAVTRESRTHGGGTMTLTIPSAIAEKDVAVKIYPSTGFPGNKVTATTSVPSTTAVTTTTVGPTNTSTPTPIPTTSPTPIPTTIVPTVSGNVTTIDDSVIGTGQNQVNYSTNWFSCTSCTGGFYNDSQHWTSSTNEFFTLTFTGVQAKIYSVLDAHHGIAGVSIDGGAETNVDLYAPARTPNSPVWTSSILSNANHTLKFRDTGTKNNISSGIVVTLDRIDIINSTGTNCLCEQNLCSTSCTFNKIIGTTYGVGTTNQISCQRESGLGSTPSATDIQNFCNRVNRTKGDSDGVNGIDATDYLYYVRVVNGGNVPSWVNTDFDGNGSTTRTDRDIVIANLQ